MVVHAKHGPGPRRRPRSESDSVLVRQYYAATSLGGWRAVIGQAQWADDLAACDYCPACGLDPVSARLGPASAAAGPGGPQCARPRRAPQQAARRSMLDVLLAAVATFAVAVTVGKNADCSQYGPLQQCWRQASQHHLGQVLVAALTTMPLALRRIRPLTAFWVIAAAAVAAPHLATTSSRWPRPRSPRYSAVVYSRYRVAAIVSVPLAGCWSRPRSTPSPSRCACRARSRSCWAAPGRVSGQAIRIMAAPGRRVAGAALPAAGRA